MTYIPHTKTERDAMLKAIGAKSLDDLFSHLPAEVKTGALNLQKGLGEMELSAEMAHRARKNRSARDLVCFLGAGAYDHFIPPVVDQLILRGELYTAYTPYQPEISQGVLQIIYEFQSLMATLCGCDVSNASLYDGGTALVEGCQMALRQTARNLVVVDGTVHPHYIQTVKSLLKVQHVEVQGVAPKSGEFRSDMNGLIKAANENVAAIVVGYPNFYGTIGDLRELSEAVHARGAMLVAASNPFAFGLIEPAGTLGADIVCGEAQALGVPMQFGGPYLGYLACKKEFVRRMPGRLVGQTVDVQGRRAFTLTLQAREQHIRREKATSNICTNEALCAMMAHFYLCCVGPSGLKRAGELSAGKTQLLRENLRGAKGVRNVPDYAAFNEFVFETEKPAKEVLSGLLKQGILGGLDLGQYDPARAHQILVAVTEKRSDVEIEGYVSALASV
ncbi:MAG TPA: aminomethyl-transferring glycine dehydrogenase subunit GcvPA [Planctomycetota bacterium]|nr:aminomethyl-transferring glycine dehydrogenase subunit GcvPA [Planctomycetota bacterium]